MQFAGIGVNNLQKIITWLQDGGIIFAGSDTRRAVNVSWSNNNLNKEVNVYHWIQWVCVTVVYLVQVDSDLY